ncbi:MAG: formate dehydrogenase subunit delta [Steroidobacteraceae bacterium]
MNVETLVTMANQIADFFDSEAGPAAAPQEIAAHITKFWAPRMRAAYMAHAAAGGAGLRQSALAAASLLKPVQVASTTA